MGLRRNDFICSESSEQEAEGEAWQGWAEHLRLLLGEPGWAQHSSAMAMGSAHACPQSHSGQHQFAMPSAPESAATHCQVFSLVGIQLTQGQVLRSRALVENQGRDKASLRLPVL
jgi:hypothetical protein